MGDGGIYVFLVFIYDVFFIKDVYYMYELLRWILEVKKGVWYENSMDCGKR